MPPCRYRTPLCILYPPKVIAAACYVLAQRLYDGSNSPSLDARLAPIHPSATLPTPPAHKSVSPDANQAVLAFFALTELELQDVIGENLIRPLLLKLAKSPTRLAQHSPRVLSARGCAGTTRPPRRAVGGTPDSPTTSRAQRLNVDVDRTAK